MIMPAPVALRTPSVMTTAELAAWAAIGKNAVPRLVVRFGIRELSGNTKNHRFGVHDVLRKILGVTPATPEEMELLLKPLQDAAWVGAVTGISRSALSAGARAKSQRFPAPVDLTRTGKDQAAPRTRRWLPAQIEAHLRGEDIPFVIAKKAPEPAPSPLAGNVLAAICGGNGEISRQCQL